MFRTKRLTSDQEDVVLALLTSGGKLPEMLLLLLFKKMLLLLCRQAARDCQDTDRIHGATLSASRRPRSGEETTD